MNRQGRLREAVDLHGAGKLEAAEGIYRELLAVKFRRADVNHLLGVLRVQRGSVEEGAGLIREALEAKPRAAPIHNHLANALVQLNRHREAVKHYRKAIALNPKMADAQSNLGNVLLEVGQPEEAVKACRRALALEPRLAEAHFNLSLALQELGRLEEAAKACDKALRLRRDYPKARSQRALLAMKMCEWDVVRDLRIGQELEQGAPVVMPLAFLALSDDPVAQRRVAELYLAEQRLDHIEAMPPPVKEEGGRLRIGYLSADFHDHAVMHLCVGMFECHDRSAFEVHALSIGP
ncbi:MAG: tetratricopeptide repeat protein, partial [Akkermansiaceae bacterium]|nr:tetratricopeptide repeat protein [Akkermansiaceae bacterium]